MTRCGAYRKEDRESVRVAAIFVVLLVVISLLAMTVVARADDLAGPPAKASELFQTGKVWTLHLRFTPERWAAMEPAGGTNPFEMSGFGLGMFLTPSVMRDGDKDKSKGLSAAEFRELGERWFAAWDRDGDGVLDSRQIREGLKGTLMPPGQEGRGGPPPGMTLQGQEGKRNGLSAMMGVEFEYVHANWNLKGGPFRTWPSATKATAPSWSHATRSSGPSRSP